MHTFCSLQATYVTPDAPMSFVEVIVDGTHGRRFKVTVGCQNEKNMVKTYD